MSKFLYKTFFLSNFQHKNHSCTQAVVLGQFTAEPNYAQIFKFLEDKTLDGSDLLYGLIWDMAILEFAMSLHTKRGEVTKRRRALQCIWQLELNTNNDEEILKVIAIENKESYNFRKPYVLIFTTNSHTMILDWLWSQTNISVCK